MRVDHNDDGSVDVYVRQSWIKDAVACNERGRQAIVRPEWSEIANELTAFGTAVHAGAAATLLDPEQTMHAGLEAMTEEWERLLDGPIKFVKHQPAELEPLLHKAFDDWYHSIRPAAITGCDIISVEQPFEFLFDTFWIGDMEVRVHGKGTADLVTTTGVWDWKTSARKYNQREKQQQDVQSTMYASAAAALGHAEFPVTFKFGVMIRGGGAQIVPVHRTTAHVAWLKAIVRGLVRQAILLGTEEPWSVNDTHYLCNETWCPWYSVCRGAYLSPADHAPQEAA